MRRKVKTSPPTAGLRPYWPLLAIMAAILAASAWLAVGTTWSYPAWSGPVVMESPVHGTVGGNATFTSGNWQIRFLEHISERAKVLRVRTYRDEWSDLSPLDIAIGWQDMSDPGFLSMLEIWQSRRWYLYHWRDPGIDETRIIQHSKNVHIVPASKDIRDRAGRLKPNQIVRLEGYLIEATDARTGRHYRSSIAHDDTGNHSCQVLLLDSLAVEGD